jgi:hypothetical protein
MLAGKSEAKIFLFENATQRPVARSRGRDLRVTWGPRIGGGERERREPTMETSPISGRWWLS